MKKLLGIVVLGLLLSSNSFAKDLSDKKLICVNLSFINIENINENNILEHKINENDFGLILYFEGKTAVSISVYNWKLKKSVRKIKIYPDEIKMYYVSTGAFISSLDRESLKISPGVYSHKYQCFIVPFETNLIEKWDLVLQKKIKEQESRNKL